MLHEFHHTVPMDEMTIPPCAWVAQSELVPEWGLYLGDVTLYGSDAFVRGNKEGMVPLYSFPDIREYFDNLHRLTGQKWKLPNEGDFVIRRAEFEALKSSTEPHVLRSHKSVSMFERVSLALGSTLEGYFEGGMPKQMHEGADILLKASKEPGLLKARFKRSPPGALRAWQLVVEYGDGVAPRDASLLALHFTQETVPSMYTGELNSIWRTRVTKNFLHNLIERGYLPETLSFTVRKAGTGPALKPVRTVRLLPGKLRARWARVERTEPADFCTSWGTHCQRADSSMLMSFFTMDVCFPHRMDIVRAYPSKSSVLSDLEEVGFDRRTLEFEVTHSELKATPKE